MSVSLESIRAAAQRIAPFVTRTASLRSKVLDDLVCGGAAVWAKSEHLQVSGSFKARGAFNAVYALDNAAARLGVAAHSTGNHGAAVAAAAQSRGVPCTIALPTNTPAAKRAKIERYGATVVECGPSPAARALAAADAAKRMGGAAVLHPFDDPVVISGQGTIGLELCEDQGDLDFILVPVSGGGLLAGIAAAAFAVSPRTHVVAVEPRGKRLAQALGEGRRCVWTDAELLAAPTLETVADAMPTKLLGEHHAWPIVARHVRDVVTVDDAEISRALAFMRTELRQVVEPAGAVCLAALLSGKFAAQVRGASRPRPRIAIIVCGGNF
ncbi:tryptophan synthase beta subunit-like PLP-dependent enzyme [Pelagophyceae sp. CCMP2097]|nr:tryptophan synthase beta subunit-like PLP-dependent enzyme [Pelagophyceae sp. CCMP2097]